MGKTGCPKMSGMNYQTMLCNTPEEQNLNDTAVEAWNHVHSTFRQNQITVTLQYSVKY